MKKLTRASIDELRKEMPMLTVEEAREIIGGTIYVLSRMGEVIRTYDNNTNQIMLCIDNMDGPSMSLPSGSTFVKTEKGYTIEGEGGGTQLFEFLSINTSAEWGIAQNSKTYDFMLCTSNEAKRLSATYMPGYDTRSHNHETYNYPSNSDMNAKYKLESIGYDTFRIFYEPTREYYSY